MNPQTLAADESAPKKTKGKQKIEMKFIQNRQKRHTSFYKRKNGIFKKAKELAVQNNAQVLAIIVSETGHVHSYATSKFRYATSNLEFRKAIVDAVGSKINSAGAQFHLNETSDSECDQRSTKFDHAFVDLKYHPIESTSDQRNLVFQLEDVIGSNPSLDHSIEHALDHAILHAKNNAEKLYEQSHNYLSRLQTYFPRNRPYFKCNCCHPINHEEQNVYQTR
jgi:hypothetical protein